MTATKEQIVSEVSEKFETYFNLKLGSLSKMSKEDLESLNIRLERMAEKPEELLSVLARRKLRTRVDNVKDRVKARVAEGMDNLFGSSD